MAQSRPRNLSFPLCVIVQLSEDQAVSLANLLLPWFCRRSKGSSKERPHALHESGRHYCERGCHPDDAGPNTWPSSPFSSSGTLLNMQTGAEQRRMRSCKMCSALCPEHSKAPRMSTSNKITMVLLPCSRKY